MEPQAIGQPQVGQPLIGAAPKKEIQELTDRVKNLFTLCTQETVNEPSVAHIHEPRPGWKNELLRSYTADDLAGCAGLLEEAIDDCSKTARELKQKNQDPAYQAFLDALATISQDEKNMMFSSLSKDIQPSTARDAASIAISSGPSFALSSARLARYSIGAGSLPLRSLATRLSVAAVNIPGATYITELFGLINDALEKNPWPAVVGGVAGLATTGLMCGTAVALNYTPAAQAAPYVVGLAPKAGLMVGSRVADGVRVGQWLLKKRRITFKHASGAKISKLFTEVTEGRKRKLLPLEETPPAKKRRISEQLGTIIGGLPPSPERDQLKAKFVQEAGPEPMQVEEKKEEPKQVAEKQKPIASRLRSKEGAQKPAKKSRKK